MSHSVLEAAAPEITDASLASLRNKLTGSAPIEGSGLGRDHLLAIVNDLISHRAQAAPSRYESPEGHIDALADSGEAYAQFNGWTLNCLWCDAVAQGRTKNEALARMQAHYDRLPGVNAELR